MKILVFSDSHSSVAFMQRCVRTVQPDVMVHLGDYLRDGMTLRETFCSIPLYQVPGNCDGYIAPPGCPFVQIHEIGGVRFYMTHGHQHGVKTFLGALLGAARDSGADMVLYGHTHRVDCRREEDGLWVLNPGSSGLFRGTAGIIEIRDGQIRDVRILSEKDLPVSDPGNL